MSSVLAGCLGFGSYNVSDIGFPSLLCLVPPTVRTGAPWYLPRVYRKPNLDGRRERVTLLHTVCHFDHFSAEMEQGAPPSSAVLEGALSTSTNLEQAEHNFSNQFGRDNFSGGKRQSPYGSAGYTTREGFVREPQVAFPSFVEKGTFPHDGFSRDSVSKDGESMGLSESETANKRQKRPDWWQEPQGVDRPSGSPKDVSPSGNVIATPPPAVPSFGGLVMPYRDIRMGALVGIEGNIVEGDLGASSGEGAGVGDDEDGGDGDGKERSDKEGFARKKRAEMWQDAEMDALVKAFREVNMKLAAAGKKGKQVFKSANDKWNEVRTLLLASGVDRQPKEIERKWSNLSTAFKQIADWNKKVGRPNYWELDEVLKKEKTKAKELPATFRVQLFEAMAEFMGDRQGARSRSPAQGTQGTPGHVSVPGLPRPPPAPGVVEMPLPMEKLLVHANLLGDANHKRSRVVLLAPGSFNPPTYMHLRMFELGRDALTAEGHHVLGGYMSPVNDQFHKKGLASADHRIRMCQLAVCDSPTIMVDSWEAKQSSYQRTLTVLTRIEAAVNSSNLASDEKVRVMLLCGTDLLESLTTPGVWIPDQVRALLQDYGIVCINRNGKDARRLVFEHDILYNNQILVVDEIIQNTISATAVRRNLARGLSVKYLIPDSVINHIKMHNLYMNASSIQQP
ncbi:uncharacterized protein [Physcomitrium patens]|uniref:Nicotinamide/nicotinic acid mononucleotide adenylyltransferase n=1 Tax=Physcomitrium patens TaxID=3218 RepID=A0A7I4FDH4_PHYPA|nr:uncharacterized protein LOC112273477 isoform X2 [Physcomitrium patens]|eukprot:XP_024358094.1 uncharacterized protein LOC112273477 isoform X2 [Physcomitrella patens]